MGAGDRHLAPAVRERAAAVGEALGPAGLTRALDVLGEALTELFRKPDPRVVVEVALVRLTEPAADRSLDAILTRLDRLERAVAAGGAGAGGGAPTAPAPPAEPSASSEAPASPTTDAAPGEPPDAPSRPQRRSGGSAAARDALSSARVGRAADRSVEPTAPPPSPEQAGPRPTLGAVTRGRTQGSSGPATAEAAAAAAATATATATEPAPAATAESPPSVGELEAVWTDGVLATLPVRIRSKWRAGRWVDPEEGELRFSVPNAWHKSACDEARDQVEQALAAHFGRPLTVGVVVSGEAVAVPIPGDPAWTAATSGPVTGASTPAADDEDVIDPSELRDAGDVATGGVDLLLREFGGGEVLEEGE
jgi:DNA polymerase III subunit gamma/tau